jgi:4-amino-4-deoxy-L-arabinose transferase-like glycosyltransferase
VSEGQGTTSPARPAAAVAAAPTDWLFLGLATAAALLLRLYHLGHQSLWVDEWFTWEMVAPGQGLRFWPQILDAYQGPLYHAAAWVALRVEPTVTALRVPAALAGVLTVPVIGLLAGRLFNVATGRLAALLLAASPFHVWYSQEGRGYAFLILFAAASALVYLRLSAGRPAWRDALLMAALVGAGLASNLTFVFLLAGFGLTMLVSSRPRQLRDWAVWTVALGGGVALMMPWLLAATGIWAVDRVLPGADLGDALRGTTTFTPWALPFTAFSLLFGFSLGPSLADLHLPDRLAVLREHLPLLLAAGVIAGLALLAGLRGLRGRQWQLLVWILVPLAGVVLLAVRNVKPFNVRYVAPALPFVLMLIAHGVVRWRRPWGLALGQAVLLMFLISLTHYYFDARYAKPDVRGAMAHIAARREPALPILAPNVGPVVRFYAGGAFDVRGCGNEPTIFRPADADSLLARQLATAPSAWVVSAQTWHLDPHHHLPAALARQGTLLRTHEGAGVAVDLWRRTPPAKEGP